MTADKLRKFKTVGHRRCEFIHTFIDRGYSLVQSPVVDSE